jgi:hypothetical protein
MDSNEEWCSEDDPPLRTRAHSHKKKAQLNFFQL